MNENDEESKIRNLLCNHKINSVEFSECGCFVTISFKDINAQIRFGAQGDDHTFLSYKIDFKEENKETME